MIFRGIERSDIFIDRTDRNKFLERMGHLAIETKTVIYAWTLMSNHVHILLRSSDYGLSRYMRRLLTGYAMYFNRHHSRHGHLFQNRYKSIVCEEEPYLLELVRYIHLNPLRANIVNSTKTLESYDWSGHGVLTGKASNDWQDRDYLLGYFHSKEKKAISLYREFVEDGATKGSRPELVGGGLVRSMGGWSSVKAARKDESGTVGDDRILGNGDFVETLLSEAEDEVKRQFIQKIDLPDIQEYIKEKCKKVGVEISELKLGNRRRKVSRLKSHIVVEMVEKYGVSLSETARQLNMTTSGISKLLKRLE